MPDQNLEEGMNHIGSLLDSYAATGPAYDELRKESGGIRPHWQYLMDAFADMGSSELRRRRDEAFRHIRDNDVTYNIYGDPDGMGRSWELDLVPLLIESGEWREIEAGLLQRAELLDLILKDIYGSRSLIKSGLLPPELVYSHPGFLRPCVGIPLSQPRALSFYAADLTRNSEGALCVLGDRAQAPSGAGYALENRIVISRVLPSLFRDSHVHRLAGYFRTVRQTLNQMSPRPGDECNVVLLTPGPANEVYFEHAYLANYLGYTLVEGSDLIVREGRVWLTTLEGVQPVDVILRRVDDSYCDPVELREDSYLGVPGLANVVRQGKVAIANPLGSGVLENPALMAFLPRLARHLLGEDLRLESVPSWWCGNPIERDYVVANMERLVIKPLYPALGFRFLFGAEMSADEREELRLRIIARPHLYAAQELLSLSTAPTFTRDNLEPRRSVLRSFLVADDHEYMVMPGGLTRVSAESEKLVVSNQAGGLGKDTWVLATEPEKQVSLLNEPRQVRPISANLAEVPGRVADNLFWVGRYSERAEFLSRLLRLTLQFVVTGEYEDSGCFQSLLRSLTKQVVLQQNSIEAGASAQGQTQNQTQSQAQTQPLRPEEALGAILSDSSLLGSLAQTVEGFLQAGRSVRDRLSTDTWRVINDIDQELRYLGSITLQDLESVPDELERLIKAMTAFSGLTMENMLRCHGWQFLDMGRRLERAVQTTRLLRANLVTIAEESEEFLLMESVLTVVDSRMSYRRRYRHGMDVPSLLELVVYDERNPRSLAFQMLRMEEHLHSLPRDNKTNSRSELERMIMETTSMVRLADVQLLSTPAENGGQRETLEQFLSTLDARLPIISDALTATYFRVVNQPHQLVNLRKWGGS
jgi:uncharacterized circularly permuted ATP-grasp superfamily protein/uncharacterized alpha-E superfamily protein